MSPTQKDSELEPLDSKWWIARMLPDGYWLSLDAGARVQECIRAMAEAGRPPLACFDKRETPLRKKVLAIVGRIAECRRQIDLIQAEIDEGQKAIEDALEEIESVDAVATPPETGKADPSRKEQDELADLAREDQASQ